MSPDRLILHLPQLSHHRWAAPILAQLEARRGAKFITLVNALHAPRDSVARTLEALIERGWAVRNPGYGHPLRPEYLPTPVGEELGKRCAVLLPRAGSPAAHPDAAEALLHKWTMPALLAVRFGGERFSDLRALIPSATPRALTLTLGRAERGGLMIRSLDDSPRTPRPVYALTPLGRRLTPPVIDLAHALAEAA